jgi:hypothetical protein
MAYLESAVVVYLRGMYGIVDLVRDTNFIVDVYTYIEIGREAATLIMLVMIGLIAGNTWQKKISFSILAFGVWDIFYYIWLYVFIQWPKSIFEWDILFLIPLPWWGPVIAPVLISLLLIAFAYLLIIETKIKITSFDWIIYSASIIIILYTFMEDSLKSLISGGSNLNEIRPTDYNWIIFLVAYLSLIIISVKVFYSGRNS